MKCGLTHVKKSFNHKERMWVKIIAQVAGGFVGTISNTPVCLDSPKKGSVVFVKHEEILDSWFEGDIAKDHCYCHKIEGSES